MIRLIKPSFEDLARLIRRDGKRVIIYGAGMIGHVLVPELATRFQLEQYIQFYVDEDEYKQKEKVSINGKDCDVRGMEHMLSYCSQNKNVVILITNTHFEPIVNALDGCGELDGIEACLVPVVQAEDARNAVNPPPVRASERPLIPKVIHYCWFSGREMPDKYKKCIESWHKYCPDYEFKRWDENNYDIYKHPYARDAFLQKKWGFVPDYARLDILYNYGGIYMDVDVELVRNLDALLYQPAFCGVEKWGNVNMGGCSGAVRGHPMVRKMLEAREKAAFIREDGSLNLETCGTYETKPLVNAGMRVNNQVQTVGGMTVYSSDYFHPYDYMSGELSMTENTFSIHHFDGGWLDNEAREHRKRTQARYKAILKRMECDLDEM